MTKDEALHKALKVLNCLNNDRVYETAWVKGAINACEEALEQPAQDYVLICKRCGDDLGIDYVPDEQPAMTYEQGFAHGYEAHRVEQALEQLAQEPVNNCPNCNSWFTKEIHSIPTHQWQGLTDDEIQSIRIKTFDAIATNYEAYRAIEQALKEKNT
jgi:hypothetical protein